MGTEYMHFTEYRNNVVSVKLNKEEKKRLLLMIRKAKVNKSRFIRMLLSRAWEEYVYLQENEYED